MLFPWGSKRGQALLKNWLRLWVYRFVTFFILAAHPREQCGLAKSRVKQIPLLEIWYGTSRLKSSGCRIPADGIHQIPWFELHKTKPRLWSRITEFIVACCALYGYSHNIRYVFFIFLPCTIAALLSPCSSSQYFSLSLFFNHAYVLITIIAL